MYDAHGSLNDRAAESVTLIRKHREEISEKKNVLSNLRESLYLIEIFLEKVIEAMNRVHKVVENKKTSFAKSQS